MTQFIPFLRKMQAAHLPEIFIRTFAGYYRQLEAGETGLIPETSIRPVKTLPDAEGLPADLGEIGERNLAHTAVIKLNGGLGTSMGLQQAKSLLLIKNGYSFLDIIARQVDNIGAPLLLMNSFATEADSLAALNGAPGKNRGIPLSFLQHKAPKVCQTDLSPVNWPADPALEWCPPGHGDLYTALLTSHTLDTLLAAGIHTAFVSNADNLGAVVDPTILGYFIQNRFPFMMEAADRTSMDRKGGHLACRDGRLILRESAQCPVEDELNFQDTGRHQFFNTNNLWLNLETLRDQLEAQNSQLHLPLIRNKKTVDPRDPNSPQVYHLETAMGSAIGVFPGAQAIRVPRSRFAPVKKSDDLLAVRSDAYILTADFHIQPVQPKNPVEINLDPHYYKFVSDLELRFPYGPPSLVDCTRLTLRGDFRFGRNVICQGEVTLVNETDGPIHIEDGIVLSE